MKPTISQKDVHDELAIAYAEEVVNLNFLPRLFTMHVVDARMEVEVYLKVPWLIRTIQLHS